MSISFQTLGLGFISLHISLPEIVFIILVPFTIIHIIRSGQKIWIDKIDLFVFGWLIATIIVGWHAGFDSIIATEIIKTAYLVVLYVVLKWTIKPVMIEKIVKVIILSSLVSALTGIIGFGLEYFGIATNLAIKRPFPYLIEKVIQAKGFAPTPNMLASIIMIGIFFQIQTLSMTQINSKGKDIMVLLIMLLGFSLTFSKTITCLFIGIILLLYLNYKLTCSYTWRLATRVSVTGLFIIYMIGTHFIFVERNQDSGLLKGDYISGSVLIETDNYSVYPSQYWSLKEISFEAIHHSFPWGLGPGKFNGFAHEFKKNDINPTHVPHPDPHSTYLGTLAENGLLGLIAFSGIIYFVINYSRKILHNYSSNQFILACLPSIFIVIGIEAISTDVMNFRHAWVLLIFLVFNYQYLKSISSKSLNL